MSSNILPAAPNTIDLIQSSINGSISVVFSKSRGSGYDAAVNFSKSADQYAESLVGKTTYHFAAFGRTRNQAALALAVVRNMRSTKGFQIIAGGKVIQDWPRVESILKCYLESSSLNDYRAHCIKIVHESSLIDRNLTEINEVLKVDLSFMGVNKKVSEGSFYKFPCAYLHSRSFKFQPGHPSSKADQLISGAIKEGCDWCPNFKPTIETI